MPRLYELTDKYNSLIALLESDDEGNIDAKLAGELASIEGDIRDKIESMCRLVKNLDGTADVFEAEEKRLAARRRTLERNIDSLKAYMQQQLETLGETSIKAGLFTVRIQPNSMETVIVPDDISRVPAIYYRYNPPVIDKTKVYEAINSGVDVPGCSIQRGKHLRIR